MILHSLSMRPIIIAIFLFLFCVSASPSASAYVMPEHILTATQQSQSAEDSFQEAQRVVDEIRARIPLAALAEIDHGRSKRRLSQEERAAAAQYERAANELHFWEYVLSLKRSLLALDTSTPDPAMVQEADVMAKMIVQRIYELSREYRVTGSALINNFLINRGLREKKGFCYQYVSAIRNTLRTRNWRHFELRWGEAWAGTFRENNALVITAIGAPFESGLAVDVWRSASKPYWTPVKGDRFPWKEAFGVEIDETPRS